MPAVYNTCREAREAIEWLYPLSFGSGIYPRRTRFNFELDTLYIDRHMAGKVQHFFDIFTPKELSSLKYLAVDDELIGLGADVPMVVGQDLSMTHLERAMECLSGLEEYYFVQDISLMDHENVELFFDEDDPIILFGYYEVLHELRDEGIDLGYIEEEKVAGYWPGVGCYHKFGWRRDPRGRIVR